MATRSLNEIRKQASKFVSEWKNEVGEERQQAQSFVRDLLAVYGITETKAASYEKRAKRSTTGGGGYIDALVPGLALVEMKSSGKNLEDAERQALDYIDDLTDAEAPRWVITSDFHRFRVLDLHDRTDNAVAEFTLLELPVEAEKLAFLAGYQVRSFGSAEQETASIKAARIMASLYETLEKSGYPDHEASVFLVRVLFAMYADDSGLWDRDLFMEFIEDRTREDGSDLGPQIAMFFQVLNQRTHHANLDEYLNRLPYANGGVFGESISIPSFDSEMRGKLLDACHFNWSTISPAIFGSLFQAVKDKAARRKLGEHYTTETNILKTLGPLFLDELRAQFAHEQHSIQGLKKLRKHLGELRVMDPAAGVANFLVVAYRELRALDLAILIRLRELGDTSELPQMFFTRDDLVVRLEHFAGIEIEEWPARIGSTALHLVDHQANQAMELELGMAPESLPLDTITTIHVANSLHTDWTKVLPPTSNTIIVGNPPFLGHATRNDEQAADLRQVWNRDDIGRLDYVTAWYKKAIDYFGTVPGRFAFVSTNSIVQGEPVPALFRPIFDAGWRIRFAHRTFAWSSEAPGAAGVHCVIIGFDRGGRSTPAPTLFLYDDLKGEPRAEVGRSINGYLIDGANALVEQRRTPIAPQLAAATMGSMPRDGGNLIVNADEYDEVASDPAAAKYLQRYVMGDELINNIDRWCLWLVDLDPRDVTHSAVLRKRLAAVRDLREQSKAASTRKMADTPHLFGQRSQPATAYLAIPKVFSERRKWATGARLDANVIAGDNVYKVDDPDGLAFAILSSSMFITWQKSVGGRLESRLRFSNTLVWNTVPLPLLNDTTRAAVIAAGAKVLAARDLRPERSLAEHYNPLAMEPALLAAHNALDRAVDKAFGARTAMTSEADRQRVLFQRYAELTSAGQPTDPKK
ncbi:DNA methyltransferase [Curtobacterium sp. MCPF17_031]|uniref:class I SAM-dependent DNA methyltransferase n=1 Tax=Curtobacterium sp. MCPF17_031 TaxID=2175653 RepID=UPI000DA82467|nr:DNA methyltransferase [Curtobacterium sp. MCPF17_031]PZE33921.1 class I SAM-dependent DNA methyltransferase [Curtobacterium sp. MCPF17_031]